MTRADAMVVAEDDAQCFERLGDHLLERAASVLVVGSDPDALDRFSRRLVQSLRARSGDIPVNVSVLFEMTRELLIERFNQRVTHLTLDDARHVDGQAAAQVWVMHAHGDEQVSLARLVMRLVNDLPGAGVRAVVLAHASVEPALCAGPESQGLLRCTLAAPPGSAAVVRPIAPTLDDTPEAAPPRRRYGLWAMVLSGVVLLGVSALLVGYLSPQLPRRSAEATPAARSVDVIAPPVEILAPATVVATPAPESATAADAAARPVLPPDVRVEGTLPATVSPGGDPASRAATTAAEPTPGPKPRAREDETRSVDGRRWAQQLPRGQWVVQHVALTTQDEMIAWRATQPESVELQVVPVIRRDQGDRYFVAVSGPFVDRPSAERFVRQNRLPSTTWVRSAASLKAVLAPEVGAPRP